MTDYRCPLGDYTATQHEPDPAKALALAKQAYEESNGKLVLINMDWLPGWGLKKQLDLLAVKAFGLRKGKL